MNRARGWLAGRWAYLVDAVVALVLTLVSAGQLSVAVTALQTDPYVVTKTEAGPIFGVRPEADVRAWWVATAVMALAYLIHRRWSLATLIMAVLAAASQAFDPGELNVTNPAIHLVVPLILYTLVSRAPTRRYATIVFGATVVGALGRGLMWTVRHPANTGNNLIRMLWDGLGWALIGLLAVAIAYAWGDSTRSRRAHLRTLEQRAADLEREQQQLGSLAAAAERARIARDLHDIVAHRVTGMIIQAGAARALVRDDNGLAAQALQAVEAGGREAMAELRGLLGVLASSGPDSPDGVCSTSTSGSTTDAPFAPAPGTAALPALVATAGLPVRLRVSGDSSRLPRGIDLAVYRIVQEALTNAARYSARTGSTVDIQVGPDAVRVEVTDDAPVPAHVVSRAYGTGRGLVGMRERVVPHGGTFDAGAGVDGCWRVRAVMPIPAGRVSSSQPTVATETP